MKNFYRLAITFLALIAFFALSNSIFSADKTDSQWQVVKGKVLTGQPWSPDNSGKIFINKKAKEMKVTCKLGTFRINFPQKKVFKMTKDSKWEPMKVKRLFQRNNGFIIVVKFDKDRFRVDLEKQCKLANKYLGGIERVMQ